MTISVDWPNKIVESTADILDLPAFKEEIRVLEGSTLGVLRDPIITYKKVALGGGAYFHAVDFINGYTLKFPTPGNYAILGNLNCTIVPVAGVYIEKTKASAFATVAGGGGGSSPADIWTYPGRTLTSSAGLTADQDKKLDELHRRQGLKASEPLVVGPTQILAGDIVLEVTTAGEVVTVERQP